MPMNWWIASNCCLTNCFSSCKVSILSSKVSILPSKAAISSEQPQVGDGELNPDAAGVTAVALTPCSTQEATSNWSIVPLTLKNE